MSRSELKEEPIFLDPLSDDLTCSICLQVLSDPELTSCCGNHFCRPCVKQLNAERRPCPLCAAPEFSSMLDKYFVRKVNQLAVACPLKKKGCKWEGKYGELERHLDAEVGGCRFSVTECSYGCGERVAHGDMDAHQTCCPRRPYPCKFCHHNTIFSEIERHWDGCEQYPLACPNHCGEMDVQRRHMEFHLGHECLMAVVPCSFVYAGCQVAVPRKILAQHLKESTQEHLELVSSKCFQMCEQFPANLQQQMSEKLREKEARISKLESRLKERDREVNLLRQRLNSLEEDVVDLRDDVRILRSTLLVPPFEFVMMGFEKSKKSDEQWIGPPFYSHIGTLC